MPRRYHGALSFLAARSDWDPSPDTVLGELIEATRPGYRPPPSTPSPTEAEQEYERQRRIRSDREYAEAKNKREAESLREQLEMDRLYRKRNHFGNLEY